MTRNQWNIYKNEDGKTWPTENEVYLVFLRTRIPRYVIAEFRNDGGTRPEWIDKMSSPIPISHEVTHWRDLPPPPPS